MKRLLFLLLILYSFRVLGQVVPYDPLKHNPVNKAWGMAQAMPLDARSYYYDPALFKYRPFKSTDEVNQYFSNHLYRVGHAPIYINIGGTLNADGTFTGGNIYQYFYRNGVNDADLVRSTVIDEADPLSVHITDSTAMLSSYLRSNVAAITYQPKGNYLTSEIDPLSIHITDSAAMLSKYLLNNVAAATYQPKGSYITSELDPLSVHIVDSAAMLAPYARKAELSSSSGWALTGNTITAGAAFLGTKNNTSLRFITNNTQKMVLDSLGNLTLNGNQTVSNYITYKDNGGYVGYVEKANTGTGIINQHDLALENDTHGDVVLYNDNTSGSIRMGIASLGSPLMSINPTGAVGVYYGMNIGGGSDLSTVNGSARLKITGTNYYPISFTDGIATLETFINNTNSNAAVQIYTATNHKLGLSANSAVPFLVLHPSSNVTIGSVTDNSNGRLQVTGNLTMQVAGNTLKLASGTTSSPPLNIPTGTFRTVPASGDVESDGTNLRWTDNFGTPWYITKSSNTGITLDSLTLFANNSGTTTPARLYMKNNTLATASVPKQYPPSIAFQGHAWNGSTDETNSGFITYQPNSGGHGSFNFVIGSYTMTLNDGNLTVPSITSSASQLQGNTYLYTVQDGSIPVCWNCGGGGFSGTGSGYSQGHLVIGKNGLSLGYDYNVKSGGISYELGLQEAYQQTGTAGSRDLFISPYIVSLGSGVHYFIDAGINSGQNFSGTHNSKFSVDYSGNVKAIEYTLSALNTAPASATDTGTTGEIRVTSTYIYVCIATNTWVRAALSTW